MFPVLDQMIVPSNHFLADTFISLIFFSSLLATLFSFSVDQAWVCTSYVIQRGSKWDVEDALGASFWICLLKDERKVKILTFKSG